MYEFRDDCQLFEMTKYGFVCGFLSSGICSHGVHEKRVFMHTCMCVSVFCVCHGQAHDIIHFVFIYPVIATPQIWPHFVQDTGIQYHLWWYKSQKSSWSHIRYKRKLWLHRHTHTRFPMPFHASYTKKYLLKFTRMQCKPAYSIDEGRKVIAQQFFFFAFDVILQFVCWVFVRRYLHRSKLFLKSTLIIFCYCWRSTTVLNFFMGNNTNFKLDEIKNRRVWKPNRIV